MIMVTIQQRRCCIIPNRFYYLGCFIVLLVRQQLGYHNTSSSSMVVMMMVGDVVVDAFVPISCPSPPAAATAAPMGKIRSPGRYVETTSTTTSSFYFGPLGVNVNTKQQTTQLSAAIQGYETELLPSITPIFVTIVALLIGIGAQTFINQMLDGDQGLGAFLKDGTGYNKSGFKQVSSSSRSSSNNNSKDPLPWLNLPRLDFVDVAGQEKIPKKIELSNDNMPQARRRRQPQQTNMIQVNIPNNDLENSDIGDDVKGKSTDSLYDELEQLRLRLNREAQEENVQEAQKIQRLLERRMKEEGIQFTAQSSSSKSNQSANSNDDSTRTASTSLPTPNDDLDNVTELDFQ